MITTKGLAKQIGIPQATLRRRLRAMEGLNHAKDATWTWEPDSPELERIRKELAAKKATPKKTAPKKATTKKATKR